MDLIIFDLDLNGYFLGEFLIFYSRCKKHKYFFQILFINVYIGKETFIYNFKIFRFFHIVNDTLVFDFSVGFESGLLQ